MNVSKLCVAALAGLPLAALAHPGHGGDGFTAGLTHPFLGLDHLLAMLAVGMWSVQRRVWITPPLFVSLLATGVLLGQGGHVLPSLEPLLAASVLVLGLLLSRRVATPAALLLIAAFALCHGMAHGGEVAAGNAALVGIVLGSALLHGLGMAIGRWALNRSHAMTGVLGKGIALIGGGLVLSALW